MKGVSGKRWELLSDRLEPSHQLVSRYGRVLAQLLVNRGFEEDPDRVFELRLKDLPSYSHLPNVEESVERIVSAVRRGERIVIFGDYDVDGITGTAILYEVLREAGAKVVPVLPSRGTGYGLNGELMSVFSKYADLLITVDNGTSAVDEIENSSIDVIVIDHHNVPERVPRRGLLINPKLSETAPSDMRELSSSAMSFYMAVLLARRLGLDLDVRIFLDLVALGTVGDVMPMNITNRILVSKGLRVLEKVLSGEVNRPGIKALLEVSRLRDKVSARDIAFSIAPRINAPGRVSNPKLSLSLLTERDERRARLLARKVDSLNLKRRVISDRVYREAYPKALELTERNFISLWSPGWAVGVLGIVAGRLASELGKPVAVFSVGSRHSVGSVRSVEGIDVYSGLSRLSDMFVKWGGHMQAAGLTLESSLLERFSREADQVFSHVPKEPPPLYIDMEFPLSKLNGFVMEDIKRLEPFGEKNPPPVFLSEPVVLEGVRGRSGWAKVVLEGKTLVCRDERLLEFLKGGRRARVVYSVEDGFLTLLDVEAEDGSG
ncbi:MAG: single-stranded-DNA-specific exonuclease RecJ [Aquificae bacterium]|nr:single-stranded-DNA-specific exonuclease RecJ [Aquificota bacterium]